MPLPNLTTLRVVDDRPDRLHIALNRPEVKNAIDRAMVTELHAVCAELERSPRILIVSGSDGVFASGADIAQLRERRRDEALEGINSRIMVRIAALPLPVIAAIDGWALGGGAELAYAADFRIASTTAKIGNPETSLGITPAAGATWRLVELVGEPLAKEILLAGRVLDASEALAVRLVSSVHEPAELPAAADALADRIAKQDPLALRFTKSLIHAPRTAHPAVDEQAQAVLFESPAKFERMTAFLERSAARPQPKTSADSVGHPRRRVALPESPVKSAGVVGVPDVVGVLGGGRMGVGIAHAFLLAGARVIILERDDAAAAQARDGLAAAIERSVARATTTETADELLARSIVTTEVAAFAGAGLVVEAVPEDFALKSSMLQRVEAVLGEGAWLVSNTSSLSIDDLAATLAHPERFCGLHFFNPVPASTLVEIVRGEASAPELIAAAQSWVAAIGKTPIIVKNSPGFASSRLGVVIAIEAIRMLEEGVASAEDIDAAMVLGYKFPVGPLRLTDLVGLDVRLGISDYLASTLGERFTAPALLRQKVADGKLGRKSGEGFFVWSDATASAPSNRQAPRNREGVS